MHMLKALKNIQMNKGYHLYRCLQCEGHTYLMLPFSLCIYVVGHTVESWWSTTMTTIEVLRLLASCCHTWHGDHKGSLRSGPNVVQTLSAGVLLISRLLSNLDFAFARCIVQEYYRK